MGKHKHTLIEDLPITDIAAGGVAVGRHNDFVIFVQGVVPGDVVDVCLSHTKKSFAEGKLLKIKELSPNRIAPFCPHFGLCGGCKWQMLPYEKQLFYKERQVAEQFKRIGKISNCNVSHIVPSTQTIGYRNKLEYAFASRRWLCNNEPQIDDQNRNLEGLGFHVAGMFNRVVDIDKCFLQKEPSNLIRNKIRSFTQQDGYDYYNAKTHEGFMRNIMIRTTTTNEIMVVIVFAYDDKVLIDKLLRFVATEFPEITSLQYVVNTKFNDSIYDLDVICYKGRNYIVEAMDDLRFKINAKSFFQTNTEQSLQLYRKVLQFADLHATDIVYDLYCGAGTIAGFVARSCGKVIGVEMVPEAVEDARVNSADNGLTNTEFFVGDMKDVLTQEFIAKHGHPDVVIVDPPRAGLHERVIATIKNCRPTKIVYVSCNPATQARDAAMLTDMYNVTALQPVDMFPHTHHVENIALLQLQNTTS